MDELLEQLRELWNQISSGARANVVDYLEAARNAWKVLSENIRWILFGTIPDDLEE